MVIEAICFGSYTLTQCHKLRYQLNQVQNNIKIVWKKGTLTENVVLKIQI